MDEIVEVYSFEFFKNFGHLIRVKGGDSSGKSVSKYDPTESVANELFTIRLRRVTAGASVFTRRHTDHPRKASARNGIEESLCLHPVV